MQKSYKNGWCLNAMGLRGRRLFLLICLSLAGLGISGQAQNSLNVANYDAIGDCTNTTVNTTSNSTSVTAAVGTVGVAGQTVEIFQAGLQTVTSSHMDLVTTIKSVSQGTNWTLSSPALNTLPGAYCIFGHNNQTNIQAAINAGGTNTTINIPAGNYLTIPLQQLGSNFTTWYMTSFVLNHGGLTFSGNSSTDTIITSCGAFQNLVNPSTGRPGAEVYRGFLFVSPTSTDTNPVVFKNLTMDGGLKTGYVGNEGIQPASVVDGGGWDETHDAFVDACGTPRINYLAFINCTFQHWRGEMIKSVGDAKNGFLFMTNCVFNDGNATALNIYPQQLVENCTFENMYQVEEYYQLYNTNGPNYFINNTIQYCKGVAINGSSLVNSAYVISNCTFILSGQTALLTTPGRNVYFQNNTVFDSGFGGYGVNPGVTGFQPGVTNLGFYGNSNIVVSGNVFSNDTPVLVAGDNEGNAVANMLVSNNVLYLGGGQFFGNQFNSTFCTNIYFTGNTGGRLSSGSSYQWHADLGDNNFTPFSAFDGNHTYTLEYNNATAYSTPNIYSDMVYSIDSSSCVGRIPVGCAMSITNNSQVGNPPGYNWTINIPTGGSAVVGVNGFLKFFWNGTLWQTNNPLALLPPVNLHFQ
jgi:hypothetical protein